MIQSMYSAVSGLKSHQTRMNVIGNNIANVNTVAFKAGRVTFQDLMSRTISGALNPQENGVGGVNPRQVGLGVKVGAIDTIFTPGGLQSTDNPTDYAIEGDGLFVVNDGAQRFYTRDGSFKLDARGGLVTTDGLRVQGWMANEDQDWRIDHTGPLSNVMLPLTSQLEPNATTIVEFDGNLDARFELTPTSNIGFTGDLDSLTLATTSISISGHLQSPNSADETIPVFDSQGNNQDVDIGIVYSADNTWIWSVGTASGTIEFDAVSGDYITTASQTFVLNPGAGAVPYIIELDFSGLKQDPSVEAVTGVANDGRASSTFTIPTVQVFDSLGNPYVLNNFAFNKTNDDTWSWSVLLPDGVTTASGTINYAADGTTTDTATINFTPEAPANEVEIVIDFSTLTQQAEGSRVTAEPDGQSEEYHNTQVQVFDSLGTMHTLMFRYNRIDENSSDSGEWGSTWQYIPYRLDEDGNVNPLRDPDGEYQSRTIRFDTNGKYMDEDEHWIIFDPEGGAVDPVEFRLDFLNMTQFDGVPTAYASYQDGYQSGDLDMVTTDKNGILTGVFTNGQTRNLAQMALASFLNPGGLYKAGGNLYQVSSNSGTPNIGRPDTGGRGSIAVGALEMSNVDLAEEFTGMITTQRGFQSNSRVITTSDEMLQELLTLKR